MLYAGTECQMTLTFNVTLKIGQVKSEMDMGPFIPTQPNLLAHFRTQLKASSTLTQRNPSYPTQ